MKGKRKLYSAGLFQLRWLYSHRGLGVRMDAWMDERMNGTVAFEYYFWQIGDGRLGKQEQVGVGGCGWLGERGRKGELWMDGPSWGGRRGRLARACAPADRQAASWWSHLATQSQPDMMGPSLHVQRTAALFSPEDLRDGWRPQDSIEQSDAVCFALKSNAGASSAAEAHCLCYGLCAQFAFTPLLPLFLYRTLLPTSGLSLLTLLYVCGREPADLRGERWQSVTTQELTDNRSVYSFVVLIMIFFYPICMSQTSKSSIPELKTKISLSY